MKTLFFKFSCILFIVFIGNAQTTSNKKLDSLIIIIKDKIKKREFNNAHMLIKSAGSQSNTKENKLRINYWEAKLLLEEGKDEKALKKLLKGFTKVKNRDSGYKLYTKYAKTIGQIFGRAKNYDKALKYFNLALQRTDNKKDSLDMSSVYFNIGSTYQMKNNLDSASYFYDKVIKFHPKHIKNKKILATTYNNLMAITIRDHNFDLAEAYGKEALTIHTANHDTLKMAGALNNIGGISMYRNDLEKSNEYNFKAIKLLKNQKSIKAREIKGYTFDNISQVYYLQGKFKKAYDYLFESSEIKHRITIDNLNSKVTEIEAKYNLSKASEQTKIEENKRQKVEYWFYILVFSFIALLGLFWLNTINNKVKRKNLRLEHKQEKLLDERKLEQIKKELQIKILNATIDAKEDERKYIAEILHDSVSTLLSSANMHLIALKNQLKKEIPEELIKSEKIINEAADKIRNLSHKLISPVLIKFGLKTAIEDICEKYSNSQLIFRCKFIDIHRYNQNFEMKIHNIIEELINNILKHSNARKAFVKMEEKDENLLIKIQDDGDGFKISEINKKNGLGLSQIDARIKIMNGIFKIKSSKEKGTHILISIPLVDKF